MSREAFHPFSPGAPCFWDPYFVVEGTPEEGSPGARTREGRIPSDLDRSAGEEGVLKCRPLVAPGLRVLPRSAAFCRSTHRKLSGCLRASGFIRKYSQEFKKGVRGLSRGALLALDGYDWPGNVRELENIIERSVALATRPVIGLEEEVADSLGPGVRSPRLAVLRSVPPRRAVRRGFFVDRGPLARTFPAG
jgi:hypothetical protein